MCIRDSGGSGDLNVKIRLTARPGMGQAAVHTRVSRHGYTFTMNADILFDDPEGETLEIEVPEREGDGDEGDVYKRQGHGCPGGRRQVQRRV